MIKIVLVLMITLIMNSCSLFGVQSEKGPRYKTLIKEDNYEIREYVSYNVAQTEIKSNLEGSSGENFQTLADYIFGKNESKKEIPMTSPVIQFENGEYSAMQFTMPSEYKLEDLPLPKNDKIELKKVPSKTLAVIKYSWGDSAEKRNENYQKLKNWIQSKDKYVMNGDPFYAGYNPPWTIPFLKRNEVLISVKLK